MEQITVEGRIVRFFLKQIDRRHWTWSYSIAGGAMLSNQEELAPSRDVALDEVRSHAAARIREARATDEPTPAP